MALAHRLYQETPNFSSTPAKAHQRRVVDIFLSYNVGMLTQLQYKYLMSAYSRTLKCLEALTNPLHPRTVVFVCDCEQSQPYVSGTSGPKISYARKGDIGIIMSYNFIKRYARSVTLVLTVMMPDSSVFTDIPHGFVRDIPGYLAQQKRIEKNH